MSEKKKIETQTEVESPKPVSPDATEPKPEERTETAPKTAGARPATKRVRVKDSVVGSGDTDTVTYSKARPAGKSAGRKSLTVLHIQRRLAEEGIPVTVPTGRYEATTTAAVQAYQASLGGEPTGVLTRSEFSALFEGDPNVTVFIDTYKDN